MKYSPEYIKMLTDAVSAPDIIGQYVNLKSSGGGQWKGSCPFHLDHHPSFTVYPTSYYCFGCQATGNVISFLMRHNNMTFPDAIRHLQQITGIAPPEPEDTMINAWDITPCREKPIFDKKIMEFAIWTISDRCYATLKNNWKNDIIYKRVMKIFKIADEALENNDIDALEAIVSKIDSGLLNWNRISKKTKS